MITIFPEELYKQICDENSIFPEITDEQAFTAYTSSLIKISNTFEAFYFFACMNLLNAYVKKKDANPALIKRYKFKEYVVRGIEQTILNKIADVEIYLNPSVSYVRIWNIQFSFHNIQPTPFLRKKYLHSVDNRIQEWAGIRLQPPASIIFEWAKETKDRKNLSTPV